MTVFFAFLRGINVGGRTTIKMAALKTLFEGLGLENVKTLLNSGNVIFATKAKDRRKLTKTIEGAVEKEFGFRPAIVIRTAAEVGKIIAKNPFPDMAKSDPSHLLVMTLAEEPKAGAKERIAEVYAGPEKIEIKGENVYLTYPNGIGRSKLTNALLEKQLGVVGTARNWNTLTKLLERAGGLGAS
jgi:uncharacterized protein (DUF1697 family)